jgi:predicted nucleic acid-binding protein
LIVVDTNVIAYLFIEGRHTTAAQVLLQADSCWFVPPLWRSEFLNVLAGTMRHRSLAQDKALTVYSKAAQMLQGREFEPSPGRVLDLVQRTGCTAYDCEFVAVAEELGVPLVTMDAQILKCFPDRAVALSAPG